MTNAAHRLRSMKVFRAAVSSLSNVALVPEVQHALAAWVRSKVGLEKGVLIGGLAMSFYSAPRATQDVDLLFISDSSIPGEVPGFKRHRPGAFQERETHVEVEVSTAKSFHLPPSVATKVIKTAVVHDGLKVASLEALVVLKLYGSLSPKRKFKDLGDVQLLVQHHPEVDVDDWELSDAQRAVLQEIRDSK